MNRLSRSLAISTSLLLVLVTALHAQSPRGTLRGAVQDMTGARIHEAKIVVKAVDSALRREAVSEDRGEFRLDDLPPGNYQIVVSAAGFAPAEAGVSIAVSSVREVTVTLKAVAANESIQVQSESSSIATQAIDESSTVRGGVVGRQDLETLPLAARSFANIAYLVPGTEPVEPSDPTKARITAVSTGGSSGLNNELSVDGAENSDDWIGGFLQNFSPDAIEEFAVRTSNEDADTGWTTAGSVVITTKRGTNQWHGSGSFYDRQAALNARFPIENPAQTCTNGVCVNNPKQPFSRQNYVGTVGGPIVKGKAWVFASFENVHENASIAYSPASVTQFNALAQLASQGLITGIPSIDVPPTVPIPFRDYLGSVRFDWAQSSKSNWFLRTSADSYLTHNALVQQGTLPSTGLTTHNNYWNVAVSNSYLFNSAWLGNFVFAASLLHLTQTRNSDLGFALAFPFSSTALTISGFETFGDNQFATPITLFPDLRNQDKYQFRYDISHAAGDHSFKFGVNFIHEPVLGGSFASTAEELIQYPSNPDCYTNPPGADCGGITTPLPFYFTPPNPATACTGTIPANVNCTYTPASDGSFSQNVQRLGIYAEDSWRATRKLTVNYGLRYQTTWGLFSGSGRSQAENATYVTFKALQIPVVTGLPQDYRKQIAPRLGFAYAPGNSGKTVLRAGFGMFYDDLAQNGWATAFQGVNDSSFTTGTCTFSAGALTGAGCLLGGNTVTGNLIGSPYKTPYAIHITAGVQHAFNERWLVSADYVHEQGNHGYRAFP
jgi:Carboxypeptidase regulatory-like domain/TonB dependent receptor